MAETDKYEYMAKSAMANRYATNAKRAKETSIFNAERVRRMIEKGQVNGNIGIIEKERLDRITSALKGFAPVFKKKGG